jgi:hypothetical protein
MKKPILCYAFGHTRDSVLRLLAITRRLRAMSADIETHVVSNQALAEREPEPGVFTYLCPSEGRVIVAKLRELIARLAPTLFLVDSYPLGLHNELLELAGEFPCPCVLVAGTTSMADPIPPGIILEKTVRHMYDFSLAPRDVVPYREYGRCLQIEPIVSREPQEFADAVESRAFWRGSVKSVFLFHEEAGLRLYERVRKECLLLGGQRIDWRLATQDKTQEARFPGECVFQLNLLRMMPGLAGFVAPPVYSYYFESVASGVPAIFAPLRGKMEEANLRAGPLLMSDNAMLIKQIQEGKLPEAKPPVSLRGARQAALFLRQYLFHRPPRKLMAERAAVMAERAAVLAAGRRP